MKKFTIAALAVLAVAGSTAVYAQHRMHDHVPPARMTPEDRGALLDARIASVHAGLKLSADQEKLWPPVEAAVRDFAKLRMDRANARMNAPDQPRDPVSALRDRADTMAASAGAMKKIADAADPLYRTLDEGQKRRLGLLTRWEGRGFDDGPRLRHHHHWMERGMDGERGPGRGGPGMGPERL